MNITLGLFILPLLICEISTASCRIVSLEKNPVRYIYNMIKSTPDIYYAEATSYSATDEAFSFKVLDVLKGEKKKEVTVVGGQLEAGATETDFGYHKSQSFWNDITAARTTFSSDCRLTPKFQSGSRYLIFLKEPYQAKSFELVKNKGDRWYKHVYETIHPPKRVKTETAATNTAPVATPVPESAPAPAPVPTN